MSSYDTVVLAQRPKADIIVGETFKVVSKPLLDPKDLQDGELLVEVLYLSLDPAMRGWLNDARSYIPPVPIDGIMRGASIAKVAASKSAEFPVGSYVSAWSGWAEMAVVPEKECQKIEVPPGGRLTDALGVLGMTGLTGYFGLLDVGKVKEGDLVVVSGAAGATGSVVCQIAKLKGAKVVGIAGSDDKVQWLKELGMDGLNYKDSDFADKFKEATKEYIDVFFDNVGGEVLDLALTRAKQKARFVMCGAISQYNAAEGQRTGPKNYGNIIAQRIRMEGFIVFDFAEQYATARKDLAQWLNEGKIQRKETIIKGGLKIADKALTDLYKGVNTGKLLVEIKAEDDKARL